MSTKVSTLIQDIIPDDGWVGSPSSSNVVAAMEGGVRGVRTIDDTDSPYTVVATDSVLVCDTTGGAITVNLPAAADVPGQQLTVKKVSGGVNAVTLDGNGAEEIDGSTTNADVDAQYDVLTIICDGTQWLILNQEIA